MSPFPPYLHLRIRGIPIRMRNRLIGNWTLYRRQADAGMWQWFERLRSRKGLSQSDAVTRAVSDWLEKNDPAGRDKGDPLA